MGAAKDGGLTELGEVDGRTRRAKIIDAMVSAVYEEGFAGASVTAVCAKARVSRRTFYEQFSSREECFRAVLDEGHHRTTGLISSAFAREDDWFDGVRMALAAVLEFFDSEVQWARVLIVEVFAAGPWALEHRERRVETLTGMIMQHWGGTSAILPSALAGEVIMASVLGVIYRHQVIRSTEPLIALLGPLMGLITTPCQDAHIVAREIERGTQLARAIQAGDRGPRVEANTEKGMVIPAMLDKPSARHARKCLRVLFEYPDLSNLEVASAIGVTYQSQISKLLACLVGEGLVVKRSYGAGRRNAWRLTPHGEEVARLLPSCAN